MKRPLTSGIAAVFPIVLGYTAIGFAFGFGLCPACDVHCIARLADRRQPSDSCRPPVGRPVSVLFAYRDGAVERYRSSRGRRHDRSRVRTMDQRTVFL
jgi:hypothetical protein